LSTERNRTEPNRTEPNRTEPNRTKENIQQQVKVYIHIESEDVANGCHTRCVTVINRSY